MLAAMVVIVGVVAGAVYVYRQQHPVAPSTTPAAPAASVERSAPGETPPAEQPKPQAAAKSETVVPSFDIVRIEPSGEGVMAGRAEPGWTVSVEDRGTKVAEATADGEGAWSVVIETPLAPGDHSLSVKARSPDGAQALVAQKEVPVAVAKEEAVATQTESEKPNESPPAAPEDDTAATTPSAPDQQTVAEAPAPQAAAPAEGKPAELEAAPPPTMAEEAAPEPAAPPEPQQEEPSGKPPHPPVKFKTVDYEDNGDKPGKMVLTGVGDPGARILFYFDDQPLGQTIVGDDGTWRLEKEKLLPPGQHLYRADRIDDKTGVAIGSASVVIARAAPPPEAAKAEPPAPKPAAPAAPAAAPEAAEAKPSPTPAPQAAAPQPPSPQAAPEGGSPQVAASEEKPPAAPASSSKRKKHHPRVYTIRRGDTLWGLAERYFGGGWHYVTIYRDNRKHIRNPDRIYPQQRVQIPKH
jgi:nucleoid-associated protein YgaU